MSRTSDYLGLAAGPIQYGSLPGSGLVAYPVEAYQSALLDLTVAQSAIEFIPAKPGHVPVPLTWFWIIEKIAGTQTAPGTINLGSDPAHTNFTTSVGMPINSDVNTASVSPVTLGIGALTLTPSIAQRFPNSPIYMDVSPSAGTGGFVLKGRIIIITYWVPAGG